MPDSIESPPAAGRIKLQIGDWTVEPALNQLSAAGKTVKLEPKAMAALIYLADRAGQVVKREALLSAVWPGVVVGDDSLTQVVLKLRKALGDAQEKPTYIQTISKGGYRLIAAVGSAEIPSAPIQPHAGPADLDRKRRAPWLAGSGIVAFLLAATAAWWIWSERVSGVAPREAPVASIEAARLAQPAVTIRAFEALDNDPPTLLLARGITADLVTDLSKVSGLSVIGVALAPPGGKETRYLISGTVQRVDEHLRLQVHLSDAQTGKQLWSERFDRPLSNLFAIQEELGPKILQILPAKVSEAELRRVAQRHTRNLEAYEYFQRGQSAQSVQQEGENESAREMFRRAIALDASFARAYAGLARTYALDSRYQWTGDNAAALDRAFELAVTAHEINPDVPETHWVLAYVYMQRREHRQALQRLGTLIEHYPSFADGYALMGAVNMHVGRAADAIRFVRVAMRLNPEGSVLYFVTLGRAYLSFGDLDQARVNLEHALSRNPAHLEARIHMAALHVVAGDKAAAAWEAEEIRALQPGFSGRRWLETYPMTDVSQKRRLAQALEQLGL